MLNSGAAEPRFSAIFFGKITQRKIGKYLSFVCYCQSPTMTYGAQ